MEPTSIHVPKDIWRLLFYKYLSFKERERAVIKEEQAFKSKTNNIEQVLDFSYWSLSKELQNLRTVVDKLDRILVNLEMMDTSSRQCDKLDHQIIEISCIASKLNMVKSSVQDYFYKIKPLPEEYLVEL